MSFPRAFLRTDKGVPSLHGGRLSFLRIPPFLVKQRGEAPYRGRLQWTISLSPCIHDSLLLLGQRGCFSFHFLCFLDEFPFHDLGLRLLVPGSTHDLLPEVRALPSEASKAGNWKLRIGKNTRKGDLMDDRL